MKAVTSRNKPPSSPVRLCAIYTRKSSEEGLEQSFNSLDAQREACEAYVLSQKDEGWVVLPQAYDDGGFSGGNIERPGLQQLMKDIEAKKVQTVVVYKVDRLTRSLADFAKLVELFDAYGVSFVSITQQFNTTTSMGRLTLNVLLSFAQFEREVTGERIRDKIAASKAKGMWMGGMPPIGYKVQDKALLIDNDSAQQVQQIYQLYLELGTVNLLKAELEQHNWKTPARVSKRNGQSGERPYSRGHLYRILSNQLYIGKVVHKGNTYEGQHPAIIDIELWQKVQAQLRSNSNHHQTRASAKAPGLLAGLLFDEKGERFSSVQSNKLLNTTSDNKDIHNKDKKHHRRYHYYVSQLLIKEGKAKAPDALRIPAQELEQVVITRLHSFLTQRAELFNLIDNLGCKDAHMVNAILTSAVNLAEVLNTQITNTSTTELIGTIQSITERITVKTDELEITINLVPIIEDARTSLRINTREWLSSERNDYRHKITLPIQLKRSGLNMRLIVEATDHDIKRNPDVRMVKLLSRAHHYFNQLTSGKVRSVKEIGEQEKLSSSHVSRVMLLAFLAPSIVRDILEGKHPPLLTSDKLMRSLPLPIDWNEQRQVLGFQ
ncbi:recombinase family protein [Methylotenera sp. 1P/1]|uniref:recombinase family protein n=1 Tax=Methylotenera sp. 1P/1 TaxID=1131551 RepID=UPI0003695813|nr:recombinase family protein [Methylotenera sp. 1P/1]